MAWGAGLWQGDSDSETTRSGSITYGGGADTAKGADGVPCLNGNVGVRIVKTAIFAHCTGSPTTQAALRPRTDARGKAIRKGWNGALCF